MSKCQCSMTTSVLGDGCRYCQPQEYIDKLSEWLDDARAELEAAEDKLRAGQEPVAFKKPSLLMDCNVRYSTSTTPQPSAGVVMPDWKGFSERLMDFITHAEVSSGVCCCGDYMQGHADPMASGHSPVDMWDNAVVEFGREFARLNGKEVGRG